MIEPHFYFFCRGLVRGLIAKRRAFTAVLMVLSLGVGYPAAQQPTVTPQATFRTTTRLVVHAVTVKDKDGRPIEGLTAQDFRVTEDGQPQDIAFVEYQRIDAEPGSARDTATVAARRLDAAGVDPTTAAQIVTPPGGGIRYQDRRLIVLYFDTSAMPPQDQYRAYSNARKYIDTQMSSADLVAIMAFQNGAVRVRNDFTDDRAALREVIDLLIYGNDLDGDGIPDVPEYGTPFGQDDGEFNVFNTDRQLAALQSAITMLRPLPEQKTLIYFASGLRLNGADNQAQLRATVNAAIRSNLTINPIDARGLVATPPMGDASRPSPGGMGMFTGAIAMNMMSNFQRSQDTLYALAKDTGGKAMFDYNDLSLGITQAAQAMSSYYLVGYYSTHLEKDGKFRRVRVTLADGRAADLSYRQGYYADKEFSKFTNADKERQLEEALMLGDPITEITIAMELNYFQLNSAEYFVPVAVKIPGSELTLAKRRGAQRTVMDFIGEVKDEYGVTYQNVRDKLDIALSDEVANQLASRPIQYETGFTLLPGKYVFKLLARDAETGRIGTYLAPFEIPNLNRVETRLPISSVVLSSQRVPMSNALFTVKSGLAQAQAASPLVFEGQKLIPSVTRVFSVTRDLYVYLQAYQRNATETQPLVAFVSLYRGEQKAFETAPVAVTQGLDPRSKAVPVRFSVPLQEIAPGRYECQVTILEPNGQKVAFWRAPIVLVE